MIQQKIEFKNYLKNVFIGHGKSEQKSLKTAESIIIGIKRILQIIRMTEVQFYKQNNTELLNDYKFFQIMVEDLEQSEEMKRMLIYYFRNYLEFVGINPDPITRKYTRTRKSEISSYHFKEFNIGTRKVINDFYEFIRRKIHPEKPEFRINKLLSNYRCGIKLFAKYNDLEINDFYSMKLEEVSRVYDDFRANEEFAFEILEKNTKFSTICNGMNRYIQFLQDIKILNVDVEPVVDKSVGDVETVKIVKNQENETFKVNLKEADKNGKRTIHIIIKENEGLTDIEIKF